MLTQFSTPAVSLFIHPGANPESVASVEALTGQVTAFVADNWKIFMPQIARNYQKGTKAVLPAAHSLLQKPVAADGLAEIDGVSRLKLQFTPRTKVYGPDAMEVLPSCCGGLSSSSSVQRTF